MVTLYAAKGTGSVAPQAVLACAGAEHNIIWIDYDANENHSAKFLAINPRGQLPAIALEDGTIVTESAAIMLHLADCYPAANLIPQTATVLRAQMYRWMAFMATNVYEDFLRMAYPANYTSDSAAEANVSASGAASMDRSWGILNEALAGRRCLVGDSLTIADIYMAMLYSWPHGRDMHYAHYQNLLPALQHTLSIPTIKKVFDENECFCF